MVKNGHGMGSHHGMVSHHGMGSHKVESLVSIDERGQMVLPKEIRDKANISAGDKLAVISWEKDGKVCYISLIKAEELAKMVGDILSPMMKEILQKYPPR